MSTPKHPLVAAVEAIIPKREARFDDMRAYDHGIRDSIKALEGALGGTLGQGMSFGWVVRQAYKDGQETKHLYVGGKYGKDWDDSMLGHCWTSRRTDAVIFTTDSMVTAMETLVATFPGQMFEARELFTAV